MQDKFTKSNNYCFYYFYITQRAFSNGEISDAEYALTITFNRGRYPFSYNFSVLGNKILPANKNYYLCERVNDKTENGKPAKDKIVFLSPPKALIKALIS